MELFQFILNNIKAILIAIALLLLAIKIFWERRHLYILSFNCNGKFSWPIIGNLLDFGFSGESLYKNLHKLSENYENPVRGWMGPFLCVLITDPDDIQIVLKHENSMSKPFVYQYAKSWVGQGIITAPVEIWRQHRKIIAPTFNRAILENYIKIFHSQSDILIKQLKKYSNKNQHFNVFNCISRCTLDIILESAMGLSINCQTSPEGSYGDQYIKCTNRAFEILYERTFKILYVFDEIFKFSPLCKEFMKCVDVFHQISDKVIEEKRQIGTSLDNIESKSRKTFIDELFNQVNQTNSNWTNEDIRDEISSMIAAGADTTAHSLSFTLLLLAMFPDVQQKVYEEIKYIDSLIDNDPSRIDIKILDQMEYLNKVILESLRLFSSSTIIGRYSTGNIKLKTKNLVIPEGVFLIVGFSMCHRNKKYWGPDAHKFNPENFSKENIRNRHPNAFIAFSGGPRNCVGLKFADLSMKMILYKILRNYQLSTDEIFNEIRCEFHLLMKKVGGWNIRINPRM